MSNEDNEDILWKACEPMREEGMAISRYLEQLSSLLFLKGCHDLGKVTLDRAVNEDKISLPPIYRWEYIKEDGKDLSDESFEDYKEYADLPLLEHKDGDTIKNIEKPEDLNKLELYREAIEFLKNEDGQMAQKAFQQFSSQFRTLETFKATVSKLSELEMGKENEGGYGEDENEDEQVQVLGNAYEFLLEKYADKAEGAGEYFTPRPLIEAMVKVIDPENGDKIVDPAAGTNGFLIESYLNILEKMNIDSEENTNIESNLYSTEIRTETFRLGLLNYMLHELDPGEINAELDNSITEARNNGVDKYDIVLANPPFGSNIERKYLESADSSIEMNFLLMMMDMLDENGKAAIIVPEGILFDSSKVNARKDLINRFNLDCILTLPENTFHPYAGVDANVLFFSNEENSTEEFWYYDARSDYESIKESNDLQYDKHLSEFVEYWDNREECEKYFKVESDEIDEDNYELHLKKYKEFKYEGHRPPKEIAQDIRDELNTIETELDQMVGENND